jgi:hypothetical protein
LGAGNLLTQAIGAFVMTTHTLSIDNGGALLLKELLGGHTWYKGQKMALVIAAAELAEELAALAPPEPTEAEREDAKLGKATFSTRVKAWNRTEFKSEITERQRDAAKACMRKAVEEAAVPANIHVVKILRTLGLESE